jgi:tetratricopeptide (TPR) repeat protein
MWILLTTLLAMAPADSTVSSLESRIEALFTSTPDLLAAGRADSVLAEVDRLELEADAAGDSIALISLQTHRGRTLVRSSRFADGERALRVALATAEAHGDSTHLLEPLFRLVQAIDAQGRPERVVPWMQRLLARSRELGDGPYEGRVRTLLARRAMGEGRPEEAESHLQRAASIFAADPALASDLPSVLLLRGVVHAKSGELDTARRAWQACADSSRALDFSYMEANALTNLGILEGMVGDPAAAARVLERAHRVLLDGGRRRAAIPPAINSARALVDLGRYDSALARLDAALAVVREEGLLDLESGIRRTRAEVHARRGARGAAVAEARAAFRAAVAHGLEEDRVASAAGLARHLAARDSTEAALEVLDRVVGAGVDDVGAIRRVGLQRLRSELRLQSGAARKALTGVRTARAAADSLGLADETIPLAVLEVEALLALGRRDEAAAAAGTAVDLWEQRRLVTTDPQWREVIGRWSPRLAEAALRSRIGGPEEAAAAWAVLQRLRTRTLLERMAGPRAARSTLARRGAGRIPTLDDLGDRLGGRTWIEVFWGERAVWVWTYDASSLRVRRLDSPSTLAARVERLENLARRTGRPVDTDAIVASGRALGRELFGDAVDGPAWLVADGPLLGLPPSLLRTGTTAVVPSAAVLVGRPAASSEGRGVGLLTVAGDRASDGRALAAVDDEVDWLAERAGARRGGHEALTALDGIGVLHVAAHAEIDDQAPWRSGVLVREGATERWWRAEAIATTPAAVDLVVLSACRGAGGRVIGGEGMIGLTQAFLVAGARAVVATAWPVDDGVAAAFTRAFYDAIDRGLTTGEALRSATDRLRAHAATSAPAHWAAWTIHGDPSVRPRVSLAGSVPTRALFGLALLVVGVLLVGRVLRR